MINHYLIVIISTLGILIIPLVIKVAFKGKYDNSITFFQILTFAWMIKSMNIIKSTSLMGHGRFDLNYYTSLITLLITAPIIFLLISHYGIIGGAYGRVIMGVVSYITIYITFRYFLKLTNGI